MPPVSSRAIYLLLDQQVSRDVIVTSSIAPSSSCYLSSAYTQQICAKLWQKYAQNEKTFLRVTCNLLYPQALSSVGGAIPSRTLWALDLFASCQIPLHPLLICTAPNVKTFLHVTCNFLNQWTGLSPSHALLALDLFAPPLAKYLWIRHWFNIVYRYNTLLTLWTDWADERRPTRSSVSNRPIVIVYTWCTCMP